MYELLINSYLVNIYVSCSTLSGHYICILFNSIWWIYMYPVQLLSGHYICILFNSYLVTIYVSCSTLSGEYICILFNSIWWIYMYPVQLYLVNIYVSYSTLSGDYICILLWFILCFYQQGDQHKTWGSAREKFYGGHDSDVDEGMIIKPHKAVSSTLYPEY